MAFFRLKIKTICMGKENLKVSQSMAENPLLCVVLFGLSNYKINNNGRVFSLVKNRYLKGLNNGGYLQYYLKDDNGNSKWYYSHRLMAEMFIPNYFNKPWVNHKDGNKMNNSIENLEWSTISENIRHKYDTGLGSIDKIKMAMTGKKASVEARKKMSIKRKEYWHKRRLSKNNT